MAGIENFEPPYKIQRVPPLLLEEEKNRKDYYPKEASIGPYHHGKAALASVEAFKATAVDLFTSGDGRQNSDLYYNKILKIIHEVRTCYEQVPTVINCSDANLAEMMLRDASLIIIYMETIVGTENQLLDRVALLYYKMIWCLGRLTFCNLFRDFFLLENQIPLFVIKLLIKLRHGEGEDQKLLDGFLNTAIYGENRQKREHSPSQGADFPDPPLHLLEACHRLIVMDCVKKTSSVCFSTFLCCSGDNKEASFDPEIDVGPSRTCTNHGLINWFIMFLGCKRGGAAKANNYSKNLVHSFRTVTDLKAKGIYLKPSPTQSLKDVNFKSHYAYASLELPEWFVSIYTKPFFLNMVAFELIPYSPTEAEVSSYIHLMKSLIERPQDVKELRVKNIFYSSLGSDEEVLSIYRDINTHGVENELIFKHVKDEIQAHYNSTRQTWMAELIHTYFASPWAVIGFLAAVTLLAISAAQLYYAVHPN